MNKTVTISAVALALLALGIGGYFVLSNRTNPTTSTDTTLTQNSQMNAQTDSTKSLKDLFALGTSQECTFSDDTGNSGVVRIQSGKMSGDFTTTTPQGNMTSHMLVDGKTTYMWSDGQTTGFKMTFDVTAAAENVTTEAKNNIDLDQKLDYNCQAWGGSAASFELPSGVTFTDFSSLTIPQPTEAGASGTPSSGSNSSQCSACDSVPDSAKAACKEALGCN